MSVFGNKILSNTNYNTKMFPVCVEIILLFSSVHMFFSLFLSADKISLYTQKMCMCCVTSPDIDLDNIDPEKIE